MSLTESQISEFRRRGHLTVADVFAPPEVERAAEDLERWGEAFRGQLSEDQRQWFLEDAGAGDELGPLRKLDHPAALRPVFAELARNAQLTKMVEQLIGRGVSIFFSQVFLKPPEIGGPKPIHQDNFYFGPDDPDATLAAWIAIDEATEENGCLHFADGSHLDGLLPHTAPVDEPFNLQVTGPLQREMTPAPVPRGGVSFHHGATLHQSAPNRSRAARRAVVFHYLRNDAALTTPALEFDLSLSVRITEDDPHA